MQHCLFLRRYCRAKPVRSIRGYSTSLSFLEDAVASKRDEVKQLARDFNSRRASYKRQVSELRREYALEVEEQRAADKAEREAMKREATRRRLERQRLKNIRSAQNAMREKQRRDQRAQEFHKHLEREQVKRDARKERYRSARQLVVDELEAEAVHWMTTAEEVENAFTSEAEQLLWTRPGGVLGATNPSPDCHYWQYETHTWRMTKIYKTQRQLLLEQLQRIAYDEANVDKAFWTEDRLAENQGLEDKARLRAMVEHVGKKELLRKQAQMIAEQSVVADGEIPKPIPAPSLRMLAKREALEEEGAKVVMDDPMKFLVFEDSLTDGQAELVSTASMPGQMRGVPIGIRPVGGQSYPIAVGRLPKADTRTEREKKQEEREERMLAAARAQQQEKMGIDLAAEDRELDDLEPDLDYDSNEWDTDMKDWEKGLDPNLASDRELLSTPHHMRYHENDVDWVLEQLEAEAAHFEKQLYQDVGNFQQRQLSLARQDDMPAAMEEAEIELKLLSMPDKELVALADFDEQYSPDMDPAEFSKKAKEISSLSESQLRRILERSRD